MQGLPSWLQGFNLLLLWLIWETLFLSFFPTAPEVQLWFWPCLCMRATLRHLFHAQATGGKSSGWLGLTCSLTGQVEGGIRLSQLGCAGSACGSRGRQEVSTAWGAPCALPGKLALDSRTLSSGVLHRLPGRCGQWSALAHWTLGGSSGSGSHCACLWHQR